MLSSLIGVARLTRSSYDLSRGCNCLLVPSVTASRAALGGSSAAALVGRVRTRLSSVARLLLLVIPTTVQPHPAHQLDVPLHRLRWLPGCGYGDAATARRRPRCTGRCSPGTLHQLRRLPADPVRDADVRPGEGSGHASNWGVAMAGIINQTPTVGSVAWYKPDVTRRARTATSPYVEQVISDTEFIVSEDDWGGDSYWRRITKTCGGWPSGFIHFNDRVFAPMAAPAIVGTPAVGAPLEVATGAWTPSPTSSPFSGSRTVPPSRAPPRRAMSRRPT